MAQYQWREGGPRPAVDAQVFGEEVERLQEQLGVEGVQPEEVLDAARDPRSPIHAAFNWDDAAAAEAHRKWQARHLLGALQVVRVKVEAGQTLSSKAFHVVREQDRRAYTPAGRIASDRDLRVQVVASAKRELESFITKFGAVLAMSGNHIERIQSVIDGMRDEIDELEVVAKRRQASRAPMGDQEETQHAAP